MRSCPGALRSLVAAVIIVTAASCDSDPGYGGQSSKRWIAILREGNSSAKIEAATALGNVLRIRPDYREVVDALAMAVRDTSDAVRLAAATALSAEGVDPLGALAGLHAALHDSAHADVRASMLLIIGTLGPDRARALVPSLLEALADPNADVRATAVESIGIVGSASAEEIRALAGLAGDSAATVRQSVLRSLSNLRAGAPTILRVARPALSDTSAMVRAAAALALGELGPSASPALPELTRTLADSVADVVRSAIFAVGAIGREARVSVPALRALQSSSSRQIASSASEALALIEGKAPVKSTEPTMQEKCRGVTANPLC